MTMRYETVDQLLASKSNPRYNKSPIVRGIEAARQSGLYNKDFEERVLRVANTASPTRLKRFFYNIEIQLHDSKFDFNTYADLFLAAYNESGPLAAGWFGSTYSFAMEKGLDPHRLFYGIEAAVDAKGKKFGARVVANLPNVLSKGINTGPYIKSCARVYDAGGFDLLMPFTRNAALALERGMSTEELADITEHTLQIAGPVTTRRFIETVGSLIDAGYDPWEILADATTISGGRRNTASWYISGYNDLAIYAREVEKETEGMQHIDPRTRFMDFLPTVGEKEQKLGAKRTAIDPNLFAENYRRLLDIGQGAATFHAFGALMQKHDCKNWILPINDDYKYFFQTPQRLRGFRSAVPKGIFWTAMWFVPKINQPTRNKTARHMLHMLDEIEECFLEHGQEAADSSIKYTHKISRRQQLGVKSLIVPRRFFVGGEYVFDEPMPDIPVDWD